RSRPSTARLCTVRKKARTSRGNCFSSWWGVRATVNTSSACLWRASPLVTYVQASTGPWHAANECEYTVTVSSPGTTSTFSITFAGASFEAPGGAPYARTHPRSADTTTHVRPIRTFYQRGDGPAGVRRHIN